MSIQVLANINNIPFIGKLSVQYGQWDEKKGVKKELTALFANTDLVYKILPSMQKGLGLWAGLQNIKMNSLLTNSIILWRRTCALP